MLLRWDGRAGLTYIDMADELAELIEKFDIDVDLDDDEIEEFDMSEKGLTSLPICVCSLLDLTGLYLEGNELTELPEAIGNLKNLTELYLRRNQLTSLPASIGKLENLKTEIEAAKFLNFLLYCYFVLEMKNSKWS